MINGYNWWIFQPRFIPGGCVLPNKESYSFTSCIWLGATMRDRLWWKAMHLWTWRNRTHWLGSQRACWLPHWIWRVCSFNMNRCLKYCFSPHEFWMLCTLYIMCVYIYICMHAMLNVDSRHARSVHICLERGYPEFDSNGSLSLSLLNFHILRPSAAKFPIEKSIILVKLVVYLCVYIYIYVHMYACIYSVYIYIHK